MGYGYQNKISHLYDAAVVQAASDGEEWKKVCTLIGKLYNYEFINILMVYMQKPGSSMVTDYDSWKRTGRYVSMSHNLLPWKSLVSAYKPLKY